MIDPLSPEVSAFLDEFDRLSETGEVTRLFGPTFLSLDPSAAHAVPREVLGAALPARRKLFASAGVTAVRRDTVREQRLDDRHALLFVTWLAEREGRAPVRLESTFLIRREADGLKLVVYLNHHDVRTLLAS